MGEYATYNGSEIKIGTCEDMYYLRADQRHLIHGYDFDSCLGELRFRFPFPDEDALEPGCFDDHDRGYRIPGSWTLPEDFDHSGSVQFRAEPGYLVSLPCPEAFGPYDASGGTTLPNGLRIGRNGWRGGYVVRQQKYVDGEWWTVVACTSCREAWRLPREVAATVAEAFLDEAERTEWRRLSSDWDEAAGKWGPTCNYGHEPAHGAKAKAELAEIAKRILAGYVSAGVGVIA